MRKLLAFSLLIAAFLLLTAQRHGYIWGDYVPPEVHTASYFLADTGIAADKFVATSDSIAAQAASQQHIISIPIDVSGAGYNSVAIYKITTHYSDGSYFNGSDDVEFCPSRLENGALVQTYTTACVDWTDKSLIWATDTWDGTSDPLIISDGRFGLGLEVNAITDTPGNCYGTFIVEYGPWKE